MYNIVVEDPEKSPVHKKTKASEEEQKRESKRKSKKEDDSKEVHTSYLDYSIVIIITPIYQLLIPCFILYHYE